MDRRLAVSLVQMDVSTYTNYHTNFFLHSLVFAADCQGTGAKTVKRGFMYMQSPVILVGEQDPLSKIHVHHAVGKAGLQKRRQLM